MFTAVVRHRVQDFARWREVYDAVRDMQREAGVLHETVRQSVNDPNLVLVTHDFADRASAEQFFASAQLRSAMQRAGVEGEPRIELYETPGDHPVTVMQRFVHEFQDQANRETGAQLLADDFYNHDPKLPAELPRNGAGVLIFFDALRAGIPDMRVKVHQMFSHGDIVATYKTFTGTHEGELLGVPATGNAVSLDVMDFVRIRDGQLAEHWNVVDLHGLLMQIGAIPIPAQAAS